MKNFHEPWYFCNEIMDPKRIISVIKVNLNNWHSISSNGDRQNLPLRLITNFVMQTHKNSWVSHLGLYTRWFRFNFHHFENQDIRENKTFREKILLERLKRILSEQKPPLNEHKMSIFSDLMLPLWFSMALLTPRLQDLKMMRSLKCFETFCF